MFIYVHFGSDLTSNNTFIEVCILAKNFQLLTPVKIACKSENVKKIVNLNPLAWMVKIWLLVGFSKFPV